MIETSPLIDHPVNKEISISKNEEEATNVSSGSIKAIDKTTVHRICSGQVVLTLATAVKELVENSIDAASTSVEVRLKEHGSSLIEVSDNGNGVEPCDFEGLALKHHTSKLQNFGDLVEVATFGFRGEALSSLCALSNLTVVTRHKNQSIGTKLVFNNDGKLIEKTCVARPIGTTVSLQNLFNTLPVRHKEFLRNLKKEFSKMVQVLYSYCLISTNVRIMCTNQCDKNGKTTVVSTESHSSLRENISSIFGTKQVASLLDIKQRSPDGQILSEYGIEGDTDSDEYFQLEGFVSSCAHGKGRSAADRQFYFINNRPCDPAKIARVVNEVYHHYNKSQYPTIVLSIRMKQDDVDVNVTPDKRQIMVNRERLLLATIKTTLICLYEDVPATFQLQSTPLPQLGIHANNSPVSHSTHRSASSLLQRFSHTPNGSSTSPSSAAESGRKSASLTTFGRVKRAFAAHSQLETMAKQPKLQDFSFKVNDSKSETQSPRTTIEEDPVEQAENTLNNSNSLFNVSSNDLADCISKDQSIETENSLEISPIKKVVSKSVNDMLKLPNNTLSVEEELGTSNVRTEPSIFDDSPNLSTPRTPARAIHSQTEKFLSSLRNVKNRASSSFSGCNFNSDSPTQSCLPIDNITKDDDSQDVLILDQSLENNENCINAIESIKEEPPILPSVIYDDHANATTTSLPFKAKVLTISFSIDSIRQKLSKSRKHVTTGSGTMFRKFRAKITPSENVSAEDELKKQLTKEEFRQMYVIGQFNLGFIVVRLESDLFIIDQHATDEKYNFESLQRSCVLHSQKLIVPYTLELTVANETVLLENLDIFSRNGFEFKVNNEQVSGRRVALTKMPHSRGWEFSREDVDEMIFMLSDAPGVMCRPSRVNAMFASRACRKSVMVGTSLGRAQMRQLIDHMAEMEQPWNCPHGRPTLRHLINLDLLLPFE